MSYGAPDLSGERHHPQAVIYIKESDDEDVVILVPAPSGTITRARSGSGPGVNRPTDRRGQMGRLWSPARLAHVAAAAAAACACGSGSQRRIRPGSGCPACF